MYQNQVKKHHHHDNEKDALLKAVDSFETLLTKDSRQQERQCINLEEERNAVMYLEDLPARSEGDTFFEVPHRVTAGLKTEDSDIETHNCTTHFIRDEVTGLWEAIDSLPDSHVLTVQGQPGTGKSTTIWR